MKTIIRYAHCLCWPLLDSDGQDAALLGETLTVGAYDKCHAREFKRSIDSTEHFDNVLKGYAQDRSLHVPLKHINNTIKISKQQLSL